MSDWREALAAELLAEMRECGEIDDDLLDLE